MDGISNNSVELYQCRVNLLQHPGWSQDHPMRPKRVPYVLWRRSDQHPRTCTLKRMAAKQFVEERRKRIGLWREHNRQLWRISGLSGLRMIGRPWKASTRAGLTGVWPKSATAIATEAPQALAAGASRATDKRRTPSRLSLSIASWQAPKATESPGLPNPDLQPTNLCLLHVTPAQRAGSSHLSGPRKLTTTSHGRGQSHCKTCKALAACPDYVMMRCSLPETSRTNSFCERRGCRAS